jgi:hypothetical protein
MDEGLRLAKKGGEEGFSFKGVLFQLYSWVVVRGSENSTGNRKLFYQRWVSKSLDLYSESIHQSVEECAEEWR